MKRTCLSLLFILVGLATVLAQDRMYLNDSSVIHCKVVEVSYDYIRYRLEPQDSVLRVIGQRRVSHVQFADGHIQNFARHARVRHKVMLRSGLILSNPVIREFAKRGHVQMGMGQCVGVSVFLDKRKMFALGVTGYLNTAITHLHLRTAPGYYGTAYYFGAGLNLKPQVHWYQSARGSVYSGFGLGYTYQEYDYPDNTDNDIDDLFHTGLGWQVTPLGIQASLYRYFGLYAELGYGHESIFQLGIQGQF